MSHETHAPFIISGAGIGGLAAALCLARANLGVRVLEKRSEPIESGAGIQIGPNGVHVLRRWGLNEPLEAVAARPSEIRIYDGASGKRLAILPLDHMEERFGAPYLTLARADLHRMLLDAVEAEHAVEILRGFEVVAALDHGPDVQAAGADGRRLSGAALIAADGIWSRLAPSVLGAPRPVFTGTSASRLVVEARDLVPPFSENVVGLWLGARAHLVHYPLRAGRLINFVAVTEDDVAAETWDAPADPARLGGAFAAWHPDVADAIGRHTDWRTWSLYERPPLGRWHLRRIAVLGDAAHPTLPFLAQGAVMALEDADTLARAVAAAGQDVEAAFRAYAHARQPRTRRIVAAARRNGRIYHATGAIAAARNAVLRLAPGRRLIDALDWLYGYGRA